MTPLYSISIPSYSPVIIMESCNETLLSLGCSLDIAHKEEMALPQDSSEAAFEEAYSRCKHIAEKILRKRAYTIQDLIVKAKAILWCQNGEIDFDAQCTDLKLAQSIVTDLLSLSE